MNASIYVSEFENYENKVIPIPSLYDAFKPIVEGICQRNGLTHNSEEKTITINSYKITYSINFSSKAHKHYICFRPMSYKQWMRKDEVKGLIKPTFDLFDKLPETFVLSGIQFTKVTDYGTIDTKDWELIIKSDESYKYKVEDIYAKKAEITSKIKTHFSTKKIHKKLLLIDASKETIKFSKDKVLRAIGPIFIESEVIPYSDSLLESISTRVDLKDIFVIFVGNNETITPCYTKYKQFFIENDVPSQFIGVEKLDTILRWGLDNLLLEILKKNLEYDTVSIKSPHISADGYLCLSDIEGSENLFGISVLFETEEQTEDFLEIYNDVGYQTHYDKIYFQENALSTIVEKINAIGALSGKKINIFVTKNWKVDEAGLLIKLLAEKNINVVKMIYITSKTNRFVFDTFLSDTEELFSHPYLITGNRCASIQTNSKIQLYGTMFPIYLELINIWDKNLTKEDIEEILWLVKKRAYRIVNYFNLKLPEPVSIFNSIKKLKISAIKSKFKIKIHTLI
jgi:hypothetical protein